MPLFGFTNIAGSVITQTSVAIAQGTDADAQAFIDAASITDATQISAVNQLVLDLKSYNIWDKMKALYPIVGGSAGSHAVNLKTPGTYNLTFSTGWTHASTGMTPTSAYADTFANLSTNFTLYSAHYSYYVRNNINTGIDIGVTQGGLYTIEGWSAARYNNFSFGGFYNQDDGGIKVASSDSRGFWVSSVTSATNTFLRRNDTTLGTALAANTPANTTIYIGAVHLASLNSAIEFSNHEFAFAGFGDGLTTTEAADFYTAVQAYQTTLSRNI